MSDIDLNERFKHLPAAYRSRMVQADNENAADADLDDEHGQDVDDSHDGFDDGQEEKHLSLNDDAESEGSDGSNDADDSSDYEASISKLNNDLSSSNGRLKKLEEENALLRLQVQNGAFAQQRLLEIQAQSEQAQKEQAGVEQADEFDPSFLNEEFGEDAGKFFAHLKQKADSANQELANMRKEFEAQQFEQRKTAFAREMASQIPEITTLSQDDDFKLFLFNKKSFDGSSALDFVDSVPKSLDVGKIPQIRALIDEFNQQKQASKKTRKPSSPPTRALGGGNHEQKAALREMTEKDYRHLRMLERQPNNRKAITEFLSQFKKE